MIFEKIKMLSEENQSVNIFKIYHAKRMRQLIVSAVLLILWFVLLWLGKEKGAMMFIPIFIGYGIFSVKNWRCPACNKSLRRTWNPKNCPICGIELRK
jgi:rubrerythrin